MDPKYSMWISTDPALGDYIPKAPINEEAKKYNQNLPGMGGVFNHINFNLYHYAGNNPVKYTDPDGRIAFVPALIIGVAVTTGLLMLPCHHPEGFLYFDSWQPQRLGGYYNFYENFTSNNVCCNIDSLRTNFTNSAGKKSSIWLWKGNYNMVFNGGWHIGAEVGTYGPHGGADSDMLESVFFTLTDKSTGNSVSRFTFGKYWTNRFDKGRCIPKNLTLVAKLNFKNEKDAEAYYNAVNKHNNEYFNSVGRNKNDYSIFAEKDGKTITVTFE